MPDLCTIAIAVWNKAEITGQCLDSLVKNTDYPYKVLVIDNGSDVKIRQFLDDYCRDKADFRVKHFSGNLGYLTAANYALSASGTPYICLLNNDTILTRGWLSECISVLESRGDIGIVSPTSNEISRKFKAAYESGRIRRFKGRCIEVNNCLGSCFIVKRDVVESIGLFDPIYTEGYFEEVDYCFRARKAGFTSVMALGAYIYHISSASFKEAPEARRALWHRNREIFESRWGRSQRILFFAGKKHSNAELEKIRSYLVEESGKRSIINFYYKYNCPSIANAHFNIRKKWAPFYNRLTLNLILRMKKKKYDKVITDSHIDKLLSASNV